MGDGPDGEKPGRPGHDPEAVAAVRAEELAASCRVLGVGTAVALGHPDSGYDETSGPVAEHAFSRVDPEPVVAGVHELMRAHRPDVVITYAEDGGSGHPDHVRTHEVTTAAFHRYAAEADRAPHDSPPRLMHVALSRGRLVEIRDLVRRELGDDAWAPPLEMGIDDQLVTASIDVTEHLPQKRRALAAHASQPDARALVALLELAGDGPHVEELVQVWPPVPSGQVVTHDLFA